ncbi:MAG: ATP-binding cassette domain-containing protein [Paracoccaceae bacterium]|nr:ATP-binding cassette domain-containing protein [Paracoccaceae bacterium]
MTAPLLRVRDLFKIYRPSSGLGGLHAVDGISFDVAAGETLGIVGESGCGKSTLAKCLARLVEPTKGTIEFQGEDFLALPPEPLRKARRHMQFVFQDPYASLNPRMTVEQIICETWVVFPDLVPKKQWRARAAELMEMVSLNASDLGRYPHQFSGGQRQRIGIARALASSPKLLICDEAVSALDVSVQAQVINLFQDIQAQTGVALIFIAHDLSVVRHIANRTAVMYLGRLVETGPSEMIFSAPEHPYSQALVSAVPVVDPAERARRQIISIPGEPPNPRNRQSGCRFRNRCWMASDICIEEEPQLQKFERSSETACHHVGANRATPKRQHVE